MQESSKNISYHKVSVDEEEKITEELLANDADYVRLEIHALNQAGRDILKKNQYIMVDRTIKAQIALSSLTGLERLVRMDVQELEDITDEMYEVAKKAFTKDRRFFLSLNCEKEVGYTILKDYIRQLEKEEKLIFGCFYKEKLVGVLIAIRISNSEYETVLGAVLPEWHSKGAGVSLYAFEMYQMQKRGVKTLYSRISTDNVASLNMHITLSRGNIRFIQPLDVYIKEKGIEMDNLEKYNKVFCEILALEPDFDGVAIRMNETKDWDSVGHMALVTALEDAFDIMLETEDILALISYEQGIAILKRYGINI